MMKMRKLDRTIGALLTMPWAIVPEELDNLIELAEVHMRGEVDLVQMKSMFDELDDDDEEDLDGEGEGLPYELEGSVAIVPVHGIIGKRLSAMDLCCGGCDCDAVVAAAEMAAGDARVRHTVVDFDTPGGVVTGVPEAATALRDLSQEKPLIAFTEMQMCSAGYWMASGCGGGIVASSSAAVGSIGVIIRGVDDSARWKKEGYKPMIFKSGALKDTGASGQPWSEEHQAFLQAGVEETFAEFKAAVIESRGELGDEAFSGGWWHGKKALEMGLVDRLMPSLGALVGYLNEL